MHTSLSHARLVNILQFDPETPNGPEHGRVGPNGNSMNGTYSVFGPLAALDPDGVPDQIQDSDYYHLGLLSVGTISPGKPLKEYCTQQIRNSLPSKIL